MLGLESTNELLISAATGVGLFFLRKVTVCLKQMVVEFQTLRELPIRMETAIRELTQKFDQRMTVNEKRQEVLEEQFRTIVDRLLQHKEIEATGGESLED